MRTIVVLIRVSRGFLEECAASFKHVTLWTNPHHMGPNDGHVYNVAKVVEQFPNAPFYVFCDDDVLYHPSWLERLIQFTMKRANSGSKESLPP